MSTYLYIRAVPLIAFGYTGVILGIHRYYKELWHAQVGMSKRNNTLFFPKCYYFVYRGVLRQAAGYVRPPGGLVIHRFCTGIYKLSTGCHVGTGIAWVKCVYAVGYL